MFDRRASGILLHPTSLPGPYGMGDIGPDAWKFCDRLARMRQSLWQMLPVGPVGFGGSPYASPSSMAGDPRLVSLDLLWQEGFLRREELSTIPASGRDRAEPDAGFRRENVVAQASERLLKRRGTLADDFRQWLEQHDAWAPDWALFTAIRAARGGAPWNTWEIDLRLRQPQALQAARRELATAVDLELATQFLFDRQWDLLRRASRECGVLLVGDMPIFVALDSADVWTRPDLFRLDPEGHPEVVAGVPPDYFSADGQRWGNPLPRWESHEAEDFAWWSVRLGRLIDRVDAVRIDHFRGFAACWEIPAELPTAVGGSWVDAPGKALFEAVLRELGPVPMLAEDLGIITPDVDRLRDDLGMPGMRILQFEYGDAEPLDGFRPPDHPVLSVAYTGTHDNDTFLGWFDPKRPECARLIEEWGGGTDEPHWRALAHVWKSPSAWAVAPMQDLLGLDSDGRMNVPGRAEGNWDWRFSWCDLDASIEDRLASLTEDTGRAS